MDWIITILTLVGIIDTIVLAAAIIWGFILWARGITPVLLRLGNGLAKRKIAIFAKGENVGSLRNLLLDSKLFNQKNICEITKLDDIGRAENAALYLVFWHDWATNIEEILRQKSDQCALVVYAPYDLSRIPDEQMKNLDGKRHTAVTNFRGRLLNDIVASMITTSYEK
ncbi:MAG: hypothetical protein HY433_00255 [Candidatus Liptonbacteria bacterium]|nr:hypothetical protein [Candidatus Liptonbacteria bacterium]